MHNFGVMAQVLLAGESRFLSPCDFKGLGVAKRSRSTTSARSALRQPWSVIAQTIFGDPKNITIFPTKHCHAIRPEEHPSYLQPAAHLSPPLLLRSTLPH